MTAVSLFFVFVVAKIFSLWGHAVPLTFWSILAYIWQDSSVALAFGVAGTAVPAGIWRPMSRTLYWLLAAYAAINIPVARALYTPLTLPMLRAARGPLTDSMLIYVTRTNILLVVSVLVAAFVLPRLLRDIPRVSPAAASLCAIGIILLGPTASAKADTRGMGRNIVLALISARLPAVAAATPVGDWRKSRYETAPGEDLSRFSGSAKDFNVVMISLESTAAQYLSLYGSKYEVMPNLSALARQALVFENAYAVYPESIKGLFSVLCSVYPAFGTQPEEYAGSGCRSLPAVLGKAGYRTAMFHSGRFEYLGMESIVRDRGYQTLEDAGDIGGNHNSSFGVDEPATVARMLAWIDSLPGGQRFFLSYLPIAGHHPYATPAPGPFTGTEEIDQYRNALHYGDISLGQLMAGLRARGLDKKTIWIVYGDHGEAFDQHQGNYGHTFFLYEENVHVPLIVAAPGLMAGQERVHKVVSLVDAAPTILDLMGISPPRSYQGRTMLVPSPRMALFFADYSLGLLGLRDGRWKFIYEIGSGRTELYDLYQDSREIVNLAPERGPRASWYGTVVRSWSEAQKDYLRNERMHPAGLLLFSVDQSGEPGVPNPSVRKGAY
jgi:phosphoglycerol transferase MdoB-like AlkP superfamily enzyme